MYIWQCLSNKWVSERAFGRNSTRGSGPYYGAGQPGSCSGANLQETLRCYWNYRQYGANLTFVIPMCSWIYTKCRFFSVKHITFIVKNTFKATCFGSTEPTLGLFVRTDPYPITSIFGIPSVYNDGTYNAYTLCRIQYTHYIYHHCKHLGSQMYW